MTRFQAPTGGFIVPDDGAHHHCVIVWNGKRWRFYLDGEEAA